LMGGLDGGGLRKRMKVVMGKRRTRTTRGALRIPGGFVSGVVVVEIWGRTDKWASSVPWSAAGADSDRGPLSRGVMWMNRWFR
jgi:hypothetical protein